MQPRCERFSVRSKKEWEPSLWDCFKDVHSLKDFVEFLPLLIPRPVLQLQRMARHPVWAWYDHKHYSWAESLKVGDRVIDCRNRVVTITGWEDRYDFIDENGQYHDVITCCEPYRGM